MRILSFLMLPALMMVLGACSRTDLESDLPGNTSSAKGAANGADEAPDLSKACLAQKVKEARKLNIVNGSTDATMFDISPEEKRAIGALMYYFEDYGWSNICTATLVAPNVVISAAHCVVPEYGWDEPEPAAYYSFGIGEDMADSPQLFEIVKYYSYPDWDEDAHESSVNDVSIFILKDDLTKMPGIKPIELNFFDISFLLGEKVQNVGYGATVSGGMDDNTKRFWTAEEVVKVKDGYFTVDGKGESSVCSGDSGGPALYRMPDGILRVVGTVSGGDMSCVDEDEYARVDYSLDWIERRDVAGGKITGCLDLTAKGECTLNGTIARWCENGEVKYENCAAANKFCRADGQGDYRCRENLCGELNWSGECAGSIARWCENGEILERNCALCGETCGASPSLGNYCLSGK